MKKILALVLATIMVAVGLVGCTTLEGDDRGAVINMYLTTEVLNFDPQAAITDDAMFQICSMLYEGLTTLDSDGDWHKAIMDSYSVNEDDRDGYSITIELKETRWTDGRTVQANDFVFAWKRLVNPNSQCEGANLLYDIKNARQINLGNVSVDDLGVAAVDTYTLKVTFETENVDLDRFFTNLSSLALVPLREDVVTRFSYADGEGNGTMQTDENGNRLPQEYTPVDFGDYWARRANSLVTNGPFSIKANDEEGELRIERSSYYYRDVEKNEHLDKYVIPYRLVTDYGTGDAKLQLEAYNNESIFYVGNLPLSERANYKEQAEVVDMLATHAYYFNCNNDLFKDAKVRRALSEALDRNKIVEILTFAKAAEGILPSGMFSTDYKSDFREDAGSLINASANIDSARALLKEAGVKNGSFSITIRDNEADKAVADYVKGVWKELGFNVTVKTAGKDYVKHTDISTDTEYEYIVDEYAEAYKTGDFDVIAVDMTMLTPDSFYALAQFAGDFSGNGIDMTSTDFDVRTHVTGYNSESYNTIIEKAYKSTDEDERAQLLRDAEKLLVEDMPICPLVTLQNVYIANDILSGFKSTYYGAVDFKRVEMKNYMDYKEAETEAAE